MIVRSCLIGAFLLVSVPFFAHAGDIPGQEPCHKWEKDCDPAPQPPVPPPHHPHPGPQPMPGPTGFCDGVYEGGYWGSAGPVTLEVRQVGPWGQVVVNGYWQGGAWQAQGLCRQFNPCQAALEFQFFGSPVHRGVVSTDGGPNAIFEGRIDNGTPFRLQRVRW